MTEPGELVVSPWREDLRPASGLLHAAFVFVELRRFYIITQSYIRFERRFVTEQFVFVRFIRTKGYVDRRIEFHPRDVAIVVIIRAERVGAFIKKIRQSFVCS